MASKVSKEQQQSKTGDPVLKSGDRDSRPQTSASEGNSKLKHRKDGKHQHDQCVKKFIPTASQQVLSSAPPSKVLPHLQSLLKSVAMQRDQIFKMINSIDPTFLVRSSPSSVEEQKLLNQITELQGKVLAVNEELHALRAKNVQLELQLISFLQRKEEQRAAS